MCFGDVGDGDVGDVKAQFQGSPIRIFAARKEDQRQNASHKKECDWRFLLECFPLLAFSTNSHWDRHLGMKSHTQVPKTILSKTILN